MSPPTTKPSRRPSPRIPTRPRCKSMPAWLQCANAAKAACTSIGAGLRPSSCARPSWSGRVEPCRAAPEPRTSTCAWRQAEKVATPSSAHSPSSGSASSDSAGTTTYPTTNPVTSPPSHADALPAQAPHNPHKITLAQATAAFGSGLISVKNYCGIQYLDRVKIE